MNKRITFILCAAMVLSLTACNTQPDSLSADVSDDISGGINDVISAEVSLCASTEDIPDSEECYGITTYLSEDGQSCLMKCPPEFSGKITIPDGVTEIDAAAFADCGMATSITIPESVIYVSQDAFKDCASLEEIIVSEGNPSYYSYDGVLYTSQKTEAPELNHGYEAYYDLYICPLGKKGDLEIPGGLMRFDGALLSGCGGITTISGKSYSFLTEDTDDVLLSCYIGMASVVRCPPGKAGDVVFGNNLSVMRYVSVEPYSFANCSQITSVTLPDAITSIGEGAFMGCTSLKSVVIPESVTKIAPFAFDGCPDIMVIYKDSIYTQSNMYELYDSFDS